jgi:hypothetical protein
VYTGIGHTINQDEIDNANGLVFGTNAIRS